MRYPAFLKEGGSLGFVAPSFGCAIEPYHSAFLNALEKFRKKGYGTVLGPNCFASDGVGISNKPELCGKELSEMYVSDETDVLLSCGGGELMCEVVPHIDWEGIRKARPKWYMGYSDNTNFTFLSAVLADTAAVYGPCAPSFGMEPEDEALENAFQLLHGRTTVHNYSKWEKESLKDEEHPLAAYNCTEPRKIIAFDGKNGSFYSFQGKEKDTCASGEGRQLQFSGRLIGGCLDCLVNLCGTSYDQVKSFNERYREDGFVWFLEACDLNVYAIRRAVWELQHAGWFENVKGFLIGRPLAGAQEMFGLDHIHAVTDLLAQYQVPVLLDVDLGHVPPMMPVIVGSMAKVSYRPQTDAFRLEMKLI